MEQNNQDSGFSLTEILDLIRTYWAEVWSKKWWVVIGALVLSSALVTVAWLTPKKYNAPLTFMINDNEGGGMSGMGAILGELGFAGGSSGGHNYEKITELATSRMIIGDVLRTPYTLRGKRDYLGNHLLETYKEGLPNGPISPNDFRFSATRDSSYRSTEEQVILHLSKTIKGMPDKGVEGIISVDYDDESTIIKINAKTIDTDLSIAISNVGYDVLSQFYIKNTTEKQQKTFDQVDSKADSIYQELRNAENQLARYRDQSSGIILHTNRLPKEQLARKIEMLYMMYGEAVKNKETAEFMLNNATPYFQVIDRPLGPFQPVGKSRLTSLIKGGFIGGFLAILIILGRFWFIEKLKKEKLQS